MQVKTVLCSDRPADQLFYLTMLLLHNGMLRASELLSIKVKDLEWNHADSYFIMSVDRSKTHRSGGPQEIYYSGASALKTLRNWLSTYGHYSENTDYLIPQIGSSGKVKVNSKQISSAWKETLQGHFQRARLSTVHFTGHSFRAGGATDLFPRLSQCTIFNN